MTASAVDTIPYAPFLPGMDPFPLTHWDHPHHLLAIFSMGLCEIQGYFPHLLTRCGVHSRLYLQWTKDFCSQLSLDHLNHLHICYCGLDAEDLVCLNSRKFPGEFLKQHHVFPLLPL